MRTRLLAALALAGLGSAFGAACKSDATDDDVAVPPDVTFHRDVEPILQQHCLTCHSDGQIGGFSLAKYEDAKPLASLMVKKTAAGEMPPFSAQNTAECTSRFGWRDDPRLDATELATLSKWAEIGAPEGDPKDAPPPFELKPSGLPNPDLTITAPEATTVDGTTDQFVCVVYDPALTEDKWVDGLHFVPGNSNIAHHALVFQAPRTDVAAQSGGAKQFPCFGAPGATLLNGWAPGGVPLELPAGVGMKVTKDDVIVVQMHYHPRDKSESDQSKLELRFAATKPTWSYVTALIGNASDASEGLLPGPDDAGAPEFRIPAGAAKHTEDMVYTVPDAVIIPLPVLAVGTHMHYVGTDMRFSIERKNPTADQPANECLVETPHWDFNWQRWYQYDTDLQHLPTVQAGDVLHMHCEYNNTKENPFVYDALEQQGLGAPTDVRLGEMTLDEMCLGVVGILVPN
ncbi:MAG: hypothetical protein U0414_14580 [Polyangiaceae bacterium]